MIAGNPGPVAAIFSRSDDLIYMGGEGTYAIGFDSAMTNWRAQAEKSLGGHATPSDIRVVMSGDMAAAGLVSHATVGPRTAARARSGSGTATSSARRATNGR